MTKKILITGSTDGIGKLVALKFAKEGHHVYVHGRNFKKLSSTISEIIKTSKNEYVTGFTADFSDLEQVKEMALQIREEVPKIDVLINNAGIFKSSTSTNLKGIDLRLVVNYFAPYMLTHELIPLLEKSDVRILNLSSAAQASVSFDALTGNKKLSTQEAYGQSKLALTMWSFALAKRLKKSTVIAVNPGSLLNTKMVNEAYGQFWSPAEKGADILYDLASLEQYQNSTGLYFDNDKGAFSSAHPEAYNQEKIDKLIAITESILYT